MDETQRTLDEFWNKHAAHLKLCLQLRQFELDFRELQVHTQRPPLPCSSKSYLLCTHTGGSEWRYSDRVFAVCQWWRFRCHHRLSPRTNFRLPIALPGTVPPTRRSFTCQFLSSSSPLCNYLLTQMDLDRTDALSSHATKLMNDYADSPVVLDSVRPKSIELNRMSQKLREIFIQRIESLERSRHLYFRIEKVR